MSVVEDVSFSFFLQESSVPFSPKMFNIVSKSDLLYLVS